MSNRILICAALVALHVSTAAAQPSVEADALFREARSLMTEKKYTEACAKFEASHKLAAAATTLFSLAVCRELEGRLATAWGLFLETERQYRSASDDVAREIIKNALDRASKLEPRLSKLVIIVPAESRTPGLEIRRDNAIVDAAVWGTALPVDGGTYAITASGPGADAWTNKVTFKPEGDTQTVTIPRLASSATVPVTVAPPPRAKTKTVPIALAVGAVALGGGALGFELWGRGQHDDAQKTLDAGDDVRAYELQDAANTKRYVAQAMGVAAIACAGVSIYLFLRAGGDEAPAPQTSRLQIVPTFGDTHAGLSLGGAW